eukprot:1145028-Pyramimonas_sp.AAC.2
MSEQVSMSMPLPLSGSPRSALSRSSNVHSLASCPLAVVLRVWMRAACWACGSLSHLQICWNILAFSSTMAVGQSMAPPS